MTDYVMVPRMPTAAMIEAGAKVRWNRLLIAIECSKRGEEPPEGRGLGEGFAEELQAALNVCAALEAKPVAPVAYRHMHDDGWEYYDSPTGEDCAGCHPLYSVPPDQAARIAELEAKITRYGKAIKACDINSEAGALALCDRQQSSISELEAKLAASEAARKKAEKDAERYRYIRSQHEAVLPQERDAEGRFMPREINPIAITVFAPTEDGLLEPVSCIPGTLDETIDAAIAQGKEQGE